VEDREVMNVERLHLVFRQHFGAERQNLNTQRAHAAVFMWHEEEFQFGLPKQQLVTARCL